MQDQLNEKNVALYIKAGKLTGRTLAQAMREFVKKAREPRHKHGKQSVRSLTRQGASLTSIEISGSNIGDFKKTARKWNVDFALRRDDSEATPKWLVLFKAKDADALTAAFNEYSKAALRRGKGKGPPLLDELEAAKAIAGAKAEPEKTRNRGEREL